MNKATKTKTVITLPCECGALTATVEEIETESRYLNGVKTFSIVSELAFCDGCGIANSLDDN